jgi:hypothetical protein
MQKAIMVEPQKSIEDLVVEMMRPIIVWNADNPESLKNRIITDRMIQLMKEGRTEMATYSEVVYYMMPRTQEAPLDGDWVNIYCWAGKQFMGDKMPDDIAPKELTRQQKDDLDRLRRWIWQRSVNALKKIERAEKREEKARQRVLDEKYEGLGTAIAPLLRG